ncbi:MAG: radical SAM protein [Xanthobacteraceae bacterium]|nr:radical SAM protein [Xanthobacteraceae bacterium]PWB65094.1 MAG: hypothetical protein C3F17_05035 [Bradyrhizobiaceae bacterium]
MYQTPELRRDRGLADFWTGRLAGTDLLNRDRISSITILLTYRCPATCDHCIFESSPRNKAKVDVAVARRLIEAASRQNPPPVVGFSGGEPFLRLKEMRELVLFAAERGMISEVISSSAWVHDHAQARAVLADLLACGMKTYCTSVDRFHTPFVKAAKMRTAILAAREAGLHVIVNTQKDESMHYGGDDAIVAYLAATLDLPESVIREFQVNPLVTTPVGRARDMVDDYVYDPSKDMNEGCPMATEIVTLSPYGFLYPCCGMVLGEKPETAGLFIQDDLGTRSVDEIAAILEELKSDLFFKILQALGPYRLLMELKRRNPAIAVRDRYVGACDACLEFTANPAVVEEARAYLQECAQRLALDAA